MIGIYKIENLINGKIYIGQSIDIKDRFSSHKRIPSSSEEIKKHYPLYRAFNKYGLENFSFEIIEQCEKNQLNEREKYWIDYYHSYYKDPLGNGYNLTTGGDGCQRITQEQIQDFITLWKEGKSTGEIALLTGCDKKLIIRYLKNECPDYTFQESDNRGRLLAGISHRKQINQYTILGQLIASYDSIHEASEKTGNSVSIIINNAKHKTFTCNGYFFFYSTEKLEECLYTHYNLKKLKEPIIQFNLSNEAIAVYESATLAGLQFNELNANQKITYACKKQTKIVYGFKWKKLKYQDIQQYNLKNKVLYTNENIQSLINNCEEELC